MNLKVKILDLKDNPFLNTEDKEVTAQDLCLMALNWENRESKMSPTEKVARYKIIKEIKAGTAKRSDLLVKAVEEYPFSPIVLGQIMECIEK